MKHILYTHGPLKAVIFNVITISWLILHQFYLRMFLSCVLFCCMLVNCGLPDVDFNGVVYGNDWWVGSMVRHECRSGFILVGEPTSTCQSNGKWTAKPSCLSEYVSHQTFTIHLPNPRQSIHQILYLIPIIILFIINLINLLLWVCLTGVCRKGQVEINERDIDEECTSTCPSKYLVSIKHGCSFIDHCRIKDSGWKHWFTRCTHCECDCFIPCGKSHTHHQFY